MTLVPIEVKKKMHAGLKKVNGFALFMATAGASIVFCVGSLLYDNVWSAGNDAETWTETSQIREQKNRLSDAYFAYSSAERGKKPEAARLKAAFNAEYEKTFTRIAFAKSLSTSDIGDQFYQLAKDGNQDAPPYLANMMGGGGYTMFKAARAAALSQPGAGENFATAKDAAERFTDYRSTEMTVFFSVLGLLVVGGIGGSTLCERWDKNLLKQEAAHLVKTGAVDAAHVNDKGEIKVVMSLKLNRGVKVGKPLKLSPKPKV